MREPHRFAAPRRRAGFWVAMWALAAAAAFVALVPIIFAHGAAVAGADVVYRLVGGSFAAFGLVAWQRRPDSRSGPLMVATGFGLLVSLLLKQVHTGVTLTLGEVLEDIWTPAFVALVLSFVTGGRLQSPGRPAPSSAGVVRRRVRARRRLDAVRASSRATCCSRFPARRSTAPSTRRSAMLTHRARASPRAS